MNSNSRAFLVSLMTVLTLTLCSSAYATEPLTVTNSPSAKHVKSGKKFSYLVSVTNATAAPIESVRVCNELPAQVQFASSSAKVQFEDASACVTWKEIAAGASLSVRITVRVDRSAESGLAASQASASAPGLETTSLSRVRIRGQVTVKTAAPITG